ncbi:uncharacterized protein LOC114324076 [Camellia sinensis]|uniref:uncharacterized protein LOC114324076 n=1 Tax=Camellia sinensis TaxID=4442 RepID=UPI001035BF90|nr:uncharacterized protein LOC114324076 [Camellia sinensis]
MAVRRRAKAEQNQPPPPPPDAREEIPPAPVEEVETAVVKTESAVDQQEGQVTEQMWKKCPTVHREDSLEEPIDKRPRMDESDLVVSFTIQPRIKNMSVASDTSTIRDPAVALSLASSISLSAAGRIAEIGRRQHDAIEQIGFLTAELENERLKAAEASLRAESEAIKAAAESARADAEENKAKTADELRVAAEGRANANEEALKSAREIIAKLEADLEESKRALANAESEFSKSF